MSLIGLTVTYYALSYYACSYYMYSNKCVQHFLMIIIYIAYNTYDCSIRVFIKRRSVLLESISSSTAHRWL